VSVLRKKTPREQSSSGKKIGAVWCSGADTCALYSGSGASSIGLNSVDRSSGSSSYSVGSTSNVLSDPIYDSLTQ